MIHRFLACGALALAVGGSSLLFSATPTSAACISNGVRYSHGVRLCFAKSRYQYRCLPPRRQVPSRWVPIQRLTLGSSLGNPRLCDNVDRFFNKPFGSPIGGW